MVTAHKHLSIKSVKYFQTKLHSLKTAGKTSIPSCKTKSPWSGFWPDQAPSTWEEKPKVQVMDWTDDSGWTRVFNVFALYHTALCGLGLGFDV